MTDQPHTPTTADIRNAVTRDESDWREAGAHFDRWLAAEIAAAEQRGAVKGYEVGYRDGMRDEEQVQLGRYVQKINPYRADRITDQMEGDDD